MTIRLIAPLALVAFGSLSCSAGSQARTDPPPAEPTDQRVDQRDNQGDDQPDHAEARIEVFPGIILDRDLGQLEISGFVPLETQEEATPDVWVEVIAEAGGVRDHEALVGLDATAPHVHAALLLLGLEPGSPGLIHADGTRSQPTGSEVIVRVRFERDGEAITEDPTEWVIAEQTRERLSEREPRFYFGGSSERVFAGRTVYMAQAEGVVVGLSTFGTADGDEAVGVETVGMSPVLSPDTGSGDPLWLADPERVPDFDTPITLIIRRAEN